MDLAALEFRRGEIQGEIDGYRGTPGYNEDERTRFLLKIALLEFDIIDIKMTLISTTNEEERKRKEQQIETKEQLILRLLPPPQTQEIQSALPFEQILAKRKPDFQPSVVARCRRRFGSLVLQAVSENSSEIAQMAYEQSAALPQTNTEQQFLIDGYSLNGPWNNCNENLIICYQDTLVKLLKVLSPKEMERGSTFWAKLQGQSLSEFITPFEIRSVNEKHFMIMPHYAATLECHPKLTISSGMKLFQQMSQAINFFHDLGLNHMDIKPSNICLRENGNFVLIDLGSVVMKGSSSESTVAYVPRDFQPREPRNPHNRYKAGELNDWLMLGMTIAEKVYGLEIGTAKSPPTIQELISILQSDGAFEELITLMSGTDTEA